MVEEKGTFWSNITVHGTPSHASQAYRTDNALVTAAEVVRRIAEYRPEARIGDTWRRYVEGLGLPAEMADPDRLDELIAELPLGLSRIAHSCTHTTMAPTVAHGGTKTNIIPDRVDLQVDVRTMPGQSGVAARELLMDAIGDDLARQGGDHVERRPRHLEPDRHAAVGLAARVSRDGCARARPWCRRS